MTTRIIFLLDSSASMYHDKERTISARNELIIDQRNVEIANEYSSKIYLLYIFRLLSPSIEYNSIKDVNVNELL